MATVYCNSISNISWENSFDSFSVRDEIHVCRIPAIADQRLLSRYEAILDSDESKRALNFRQDKDRWRFIISRAALRLLLAKYSGKNPGALVFTFGKNKKPILKDIDPLHLHFNVAHSGEWILIAISDNEIGIDIEKIDDRFEYADILPTVFTQGEMDSLHGQTEPRKEFYLCWTRKEAMSKATGKGVDDQLKTIPCLDGFHDVSNEIAGSVQAWTILSFPIEKQYVGSLAYDSSVPHLKFLDISPDLIVG